MYLPMHYMQPRLSKTKYSWTMDQALRVVVASVPAWVWVLYWAGALQPPDLGSFQAMAAARAKMA